jgi:hypothetical protein
VAVVEGAAAATPGAAEPEVIKKGKKEEEGKEAEKGAKKPEEKPKSDCGAEIMPARRAFSPLWAD